MENPGHFSVEINSLGQRRHIGLLPTGETYRQRLHRGVQQQAAGGMPERPLVHGSCGCPRKVGGLAQRLQRGPPTQHDRLQRADRPAHSRWRNQPAPVITAAKLQIAAVQTRAAEHNPKDSRYERGTTGGQVNYVRLARRCWLPRSCWQDQHRLETRRLPRPRRLQGEL